MKPFFLVMPTMKVIRMGAPVSLCTAEYVSGTRSKQNFNVTTPRNISLEDSNNKVWYSLIMRFFSQRPKISTEFKVLKALPSFSCSLLLSATRFEMALGRKHSPKRRFFITEMKHKQVNKRHEPCADFASAVQRKKDTWLINHTAKKHLLDSCIIQSQENLLFARGLQHNYTPREYTAQ